MHRILLVDDHEIILDGLRAMLYKTNDFQIVGEAKSGKEAIEKTLELLPEVIIMDISMPDMSGIEATEIIKKKFPRIKILVLTQHESSDYIMRMLKAGADGYLLKNCKKAELTEALESLINNEKYLGKRVSTILMDNVYNVKNRDSKEQESRIILTPREIEIIRHISADLSNQDIADRLNISIRTVETYRRNIMLKLNVKSVIALVRYAVKHGLVEI